MNWLRRERDRRIEDNLTKDVKSRFRPKKEIGDNIAKDIGNLFRLKRKTKQYNQRYKLRNNLKKYDTWKIKLEIAINFLSFKETDEKLLIHSKSDTHKSWLMIKQIKLLMNLF